MQGQKEGEQKLVVTFDVVGNAQAKKLILNKVNCMTIAKVLDSDETDAWEGQAITLVREMWQGQPVVRVKH